MATICRAKNPATCKVHGMGGPVERLELDKAKAVRAGDFKAQYDLQKQIDSLKDDNPNSPEESKASFFGEMGWKLFKKMQVEDLETKTEALGAVLNQHKVFGDVEGKWLESELRGLKSMVRDHALSRDHNYLELTYHASNVRLIINTGVDEKGQAYIRKIEAYDHPRKNTRMDYDALNKDIKSLFQ